MMIILGLRVLVRVVFVWLSVCTHPSVCVCLSVCVCVRVCLSVKSHLSPGACVSCENTASYSVGNEGQWCFL